MIRLLTLEQTGLTDGRTDEHQTVVYTLSAIDAATVIAEN